MTDPSPQLQRPNRRPPALRPPPTIPDAELLAGLETTLTQHFGRRRRVQSLERRRSDYASSFLLQELDVRLEDGSMLELMFKDVSPASLLEETVFSRPESLTDPLREIEVYRSLLDQGGLGTAMYYGSVVDQAAGRYWLFIERVRALRLRHCGELSIWQEAARWLARLQSRFADLGAIPVEADAHLLHYDAALYRHWILRVRTIARDWPVERSAERESVEWLAARHERVVERLVALPQRLVHGEFYSANVLVPQGEGPLRICPVDWETAGIGPALLDLAALTSGKWASAERDAMLDAYREELGPGSPWASADEMRAPVACCALELAVRMLAWAYRWSPPPERTDKWLTESRARAEELGL